MYKNYVVKREYFREALIDFLTPTG
jgi:hypothetical protein